MKKILLLCLILMMLTGCCAAAARNVVLGIERDEEIEPLLTGKRVGILTNQTGVDHKLKSSVDILREKYNLTAIFVPEHGFYGAVAAGEEFGSNEFDGVVVHSLYDDNKRPTEKMLQDIDVMCVDLQDIGVRHYTYVSTMAYVMEECARFGKPVIVFDRPNPLGGKAEGPVLKEQYKSFIGMYEIPLRHGLTIGEYAKFINTEYKINCELTVIPMKHWKRSMYWEDTGLLWVGTSPLIPTAETAFLYDVTGFIGDANISVGAGSAKPFYYVGAEFADERAVYEALARLNIEGVLFRPAAFKSRFGEHEGKLIKGVEIYIVDKDKVNLAELGYSILYTLKNLYPEQVAFPERQYVGGYKIDIALGEDSIRNNESPASAFARWQAECEEYKEKIKPYLLYK